MDPIMIFALGNPGKEYEKTYHNVGVIAQNYLLKALEEELGSSIPPKKHDEFWYRISPSKQIILAGYVGEDGMKMPERFMNHAGPAVATALSFFKLKPDQLVLFHDDSDLFVGDFKLELGRGAAGHHGVESTILALGTKEFYRGRIGVRPTAEHLAKQKAGEFVLDRINKDDELILQKVCQELGAKVMEKV